MREKGHSVKPPLNDGDHLFHLCKHIKQHYYGVLFSAVIYILSIQVYIKESSKILPNVKHWQCRVAHNQHATTHQIWLHVVYPMHLLHIRHTVQYRDHIHQAETHPTATLSLLV